MKKKSSCLESGVKALVEFLGAGGISVSGVCPICNSTQAVTDGAWRLCEHGHLCSVDGKNAYSQTGIEPRIYQILYDVFQKRLEQTEELDA